MRKKTDKVKVIYRVSKKDPSDVYALLPELPGTNDPNTCLCYQHIGQHSDANYEHCMRSSRPATAAEARPLHTELRRIGYDLDIKQRDAGNVMRKARYAELQRMNEAAREQAKKVEK